MYQSRLHSRLYTGVFAAYSKFTEGNELGEH